jgi:hypothetical protein
MDAPTDDLGPLPLGDRQDKLQQLSLNALRNCLPEDKFLFRDERVDDKGVDGALEAKVEVRVPKKGGGEEVMKGFTNCRAQAQLKSTDKTKQNHDGSISYAIETSNLNYLLNGPSPIYFLWVAATDEVRYAWARDEWRRLDGETPEWKKQGEFTVRFRDVLDAKGVDSIHERVVKEARFARRINEILARSSLSEKVVVSIDPTSLKNTDPLQLHQWLTSSGMTLISSGYGSQVLEWIGALNPDHRRETRIHLVSAFALVSLGRNHEAVGSLSLAVLGTADLSPEDQEFMGYLGDVCAYQTGRIDQAEYLRREAERGRNKTGVEAAAHRLEVLRQDRLHSRDRARRASLLEEMRAAAAQIDGAADAKPAHKLSARIHVLSAEGEALTDRFSEGFAQLQARLGMGIPAYGAARWASASIAKLWEEWDQGARGCIEDAAKERHPLLLADAMTARASVYQALVLTHRMHAAATETAWDPPESVIRVMMEQVERAMEVYRAAGNMEGEMRAKLLLADLFDSLGQDQAAKKLAEGAVVVARAMGYRRLELHALEYIEGKTIIQMFQEELAGRNAVDEDVHTADESDENVRAVARFTLDSLGLPPERLPVLEREAASCRLIARERVDFCRHIGLIQDLRHTAHPGTCYATDPSRACVCEKLGYRSNVESTDAETVISAFKRAYCEGCPARDPKGRKDT